MPPPKSLTFLPVILYQSLGSYNDQSRLADVIANFKPPTNNLRQKIAGEVYNVPVNGRGVDLRMVWFDNDENLWGVDAIIIYAPESASRMGGI